MSIISSVHAPLGLDTSHRALAQLIRVNQRSACGDDSASARANADRLVESVVRHIETEQDGIERLATDRRAAITDGQRTLLQRVRAYAARPSAEEAANLLALLVRQADAERAALPALAAAPLSPMLERPQYQFATEWAIAASDPVVVRHES